MRRGWEGEEEVREMVRNFGVEGVIGDEGEVGVLEE